MALSSQQQKLLRMLPSCDACIHDARICAYVAKHTITDAHLMHVVRDALECVRQDIYAMSDTHVDDVTENTQCVLYQKLIDQILEKLDQKYIDDFIPMLNATGVVLHTNLGRAPLADAAVERVCVLGQGYSNLEYNRKDLSRGSRHTHLAQMLCELLACEDAVVVNNNAAAVFLILHTLAQGKEVIVSRGEEIEIGEAFRIPDIIRESGAHMVEVGTTNKTHISDYENAITENTALILKVHPSNYRFVGFHEEVSSQELLALCKKYGIALYEDQGSGLSVSFEKLFENYTIAASQHERDTISCMKGLDLLSFSGDKLLGAGQAGIIAGKKQYIQQIKKNPLMRAFRPDKMTLASLAATLQMYCTLSADELIQNIPALFMLHISYATLIEYAQAFVETLKNQLKQAGFAEYLIVAIKRDTSLAGGGSLPGLALETPLVILSASASNLSMKELHEQLAQLPYTDTLTPAVTRLLRFDGNECVGIDLRCLVHAYDKPHMLNDECQRLCRGIIYVLSRMCKA